MTNYKNNIPIYAEELLLDQKIENVQQIIDKFKQPTPVNFIELGVEEGNYICSTNPKWKNKPLCERYGFTYQGKWIQIDIAHTLMEKLQLEKGKDITYPIYIFSELLKRDPGSSYGGITVESEEEIYIKMQEWKKMSSEEVIIILIQELKVQLTEVENLKIQIDDELKQQNIIKQLRNEKRQIESKLTEAERNVVEKKEIITGRDNKIKELEENLTILKAKLEEVQQKLANDDLQKKEEKIIQLNRELEELKGKINNEKAQFTNPNYLYSLTIKNHSGQEMSDADIPMSIECLKIEVGGKSDKLEIINFSSDEVTSNSKNIKSLEIYHNGNNGSTVILKKIILTGLAQLEKLRLLWCSARELDLSKNGRLQCIEINNLLFLEKLDLSSCPELEHLYINVESLYSPPVGLKEIDISNNPQLKWNFQNSLIFPGLLKNLSADKLIITITQKLRDELTEIYKKGEGRRNSFANIYGLTSDDWDNFNKKIEWKKA